MLLQVYEFVKYKYLYTDGQSNSPSLIIQAGSLLMLLKLEVDN